MRSGEDGQGTADPGVRRAYGEDYEEFIGRVYLAAVRLGEPSRDTLLAEGLSADEVEEGMAELVARQLVSVSSRPGRWEVVPPRDGIARHVERMERRLAMSRATASEVDAIWRRAVGAARPSDNPNFDLLTGVEEIADRISGLHRFATRRLWCALEPSAATRMVLERAVEQPELLAVSEGVDVRIILDTTLLDDLPAMAHLRTGEAAGHGIRVGNGVPMTVVLSDDRAAVIDLSSFDAAGQGSIEVRAPAPIRAIGRLLDEIWSLSTPYGPTMEAASRPEGARAPLDARDQRILTLLATGASDQLIARQAGVSVRTVERRVRYLMEHLGAATRFQAGVQAVRRGWA